MAEMNQTVNTIDGISSFEDDHPIPLNLPCADLIDGSSEDYTESRLRLYEASVKGDWKVIGSIIEDRPEFIRCSITENCETMLHVAVSANRTLRMFEFVENLVDLMTEADLELQNKSGDTALCLSAAAGTDLIALLLLNKNKALLRIPGSQSMLPLSVAALYENHSMVQVLYYMSQDLYGNGWTPQNHSWLLLKCVEVDLFDVALQLAEDNPELDTCWSVLGVLAQKPDAFIVTKSNVIRRIINSIFGVIGLEVEAHEKQTEAFQLLRIILESIAKKPKNKFDDIIRGPPDFSKQDDKRASGKEDHAPQLLKNIYEHVVKMPVEVHKIHGGSVATTSRVTKALLLTNARKISSSHILFVAAEMGNTNFVVEVIRQYPELIEEVNENNQSVFHIAVKHRHEDIYNILYEIGLKRNSLLRLCDENGNNMLHLVGEIANKNRLRDVSGVAFQMQRELLWFKEVGSMIPPSYRKCKNTNGLTPSELFTEEHKDLVAQGEKWMKETASQCMVVAALIATIVFAAAFTVPGGYNQNDGIPVFYRKATFMVFVLADAISLFSSSASILMFLSILTSRYAERDFLKSLPRKLMLGLTTLFLSITTMTIAFSVSFFVLYHKGLIWVPLVISLLAIMPVVLFAWLQYALLADVIRSTYGSRYLFRPKKPILYYLNPQW